MKEIAIAWVPQASEWALTNRSGKRQVDQWVVAPAVLATGRGTAVRRFAVGRANDSPFTSARNCAIVPVPTATLVVASNSRMSCSEAPF